MRPLSLGLLLCALPLAACGDDGSDSGTDPVGTTTTTEPDTSTTAGEGSSSGDAVDGSSSSGGAASSSSDASTTTGVAEDPNYPRPDGGSCEGDAVPVALPGAEVCAPFCSGPEEPCPAGETGDAPGVCTPFMGDGGSGDACDDMTPCPMNEVCDAGTCVDVAFWACQLVCDMGQTCPDSMSCSGFGTCGY